MKISTNSLTITLETQHERDVLQEACESYRDELNAQTPKPQESIDMLSEVIDELNAAPEDED